MTSAEVSPDDRVLFEAACALYDQREALAAKVYWALIAEPDVVAVRVAPADISPLQAHAMEVLVWLAPAGDVWLLRLESVEAAPPMAILDAYHRARWKRQRLEASKKVSLGCP
jgi:hypothetical protein